MEERTERFLFPVAGAHLARLLGDLLNPLAVKNFKLGAANQDRPQFKARLSLVSVLVLQLKASLQLLQMCG
jgi:hypothetical protein